MYFIRRKWHAEPNDGRVARRPTIIIQPQPHPEHSADRWSYTDKVWLQYTFVLWCSVLYVFDAKMMRSCISLRFYSSKCHVLQTQRARQPNAHTHSLRKRRNKKFMSHSRTIGTRMKRQNEQMKWGIECSGITSVVSMDCRWCHGRRDHYCVATGVDADVAAAAVVDNSSTVNSIKIERIMQIWYLPESELFNYFGNDDMIFYSQSSVWI